MASGTRARIAAAAAANAGVLQLGDDVQQGIFGSLPAQHMAAAASVSTAWRAAVQQSAERTLREHKGDVVAALNALVTAA